MNSLISHQFTKIDMNCPDIILCVRANASYIGLPDECCPSQITFALYTNQIVSKIPNNNKKNNSINVANFYSYEMDTISAVLKKTKVSLFSSVWFTFS